MLVIRLRSMAGSTKKYSVMVERSDKVLSLSYIISNMLYFCVSEVFFAVSGQKLCVL